MSLTPASTDPNREAELARKKKDPSSFGADIQPLPKAMRNLPSSGGLKSIAPEETVAADTGAATSTTNTQSTQLDPEVLAKLNEWAVASVNDLDEDALVAQIADGALELPHLDALLAAEKELKKPRDKVLAAIDTAIEDLTK